MARINLLPWRAERRKQRQREFYTMLGLAAAAGVVLSLLLWFYYGQQISGQNERNGYLETEIAKRHWNKVRTRDLRQMYNPTRPEVFAQRVDWLRMLGAAQVPPVDQLIDGQPSFMSELAEL